MQKIGLFKAKLSLSLRSTAIVLLQWRYALFSATVAVIFVQFLYWVTNLSLFWFFLSNQNLTTIDKIDVFSGVITSYLSSLPLWQAMVVIMLAILQGVVIAMLVYITKNQNRLDQKAFGGSAIASLVALFSVGCVSCGTSIVTPLVSLFFSGASASVSESINKYALVMSLIISMYALYTVGLTVANVNAKLKNATLVPQEVD